MLDGPNRQMPVRSNVCLGCRDRIEAPVRAVNGWLHLGPYTLHGSLRFDRPCEARACRANGASRAGV